MDFATALGTLAEQSSIYYAICREYVNGFSILELRYFIKGEYIQ